MPKIGNIRNIVPKVRLTSIIKLKGEKEKDTKPIHIYTRYDSIIHDTSILTLSPDTCGLHEVKSKPIADTVTVDTTVSTGEGEKSVLTEKYVSYLKNIVDISRGSELDFKAFLEFVTEKALKKNLRSFPVKLSDIEDPKTRSLPYIAVPEDVQPSAVVREGNLKLFKLPPKQRIGNIERVPEDKLLDDNCLIYLPKPYLVATSDSLHRELYPHDASYIISVLLKTGEPDKIKIARDMLDNFAYEVKVFGYPLNGNRGYYITRSQTNNIPTNVLEYYRATGDIKWLEETGLPMAVSIYKYWTNKEAEVNLDGFKAYRWIAHGKGPCKEVWESHEAHNQYYFKVLSELVKYSQLPDAMRPKYARGFDYSKVIREIPRSEVERLLQSGDLRAENIKDLKVKCYVLNREVTSSGKDEPVIEVNGRYYTFTQEYYKNDRAGRVSGYDSNHLYGPFNAFTGEFIPVAHNVQLYKHAKDIATMYRILAERTGKQEYIEASKQWEVEASQLKRTILELLWDDQRGMLFELHIPSRKLRTEYPFASSCYALWAGVFDVNVPEEKEKLLKLVDFMTSNLEGPNGIYASAIETGLHWDKPYCWPIHQGMIVKGLREYAKRLEETGDLQNAEKLRSIADRIAVKYLNANYRSWLKSKGSAIGEKVGPEIEHIFTGYLNGSNYTWNLAAVWDLYSDLSPEVKEVIKS